MARIGVLLIGLTLLGVSAYADIGAIHVSGWSPGEIMAGAFDGVGLYPGPDGKYDPATILPTGATGVSDFVSESLDLTGLIPGEDTRPAMEQASEVITSTITASVSDLIGPSHEIALDFPTITEPTPLPPDTVPNMTTQLTDYLDSAPGVPVFSGQFQGVMPQLSAEVQEVFNTLPIPGISDLLGGQ